jgi:hypothetical protein
MRVHYDVRGGAHVLRDAYVLRLETQRHRAETIAVSESVSEEERTTSIVRRDSSFAYVFKRRPHRSGWSIATTVDGDGSTTGNGPGKPAMGTGFSTECRPRAPAPPGAYHEVLMILRNAQRHLSSAEQVDPRRYCDLS